MKNKKLTQKLEKCFSTLSDLREVIVQSNDAHEQLITEIDTCNADQGWGFQTKTSVRINEFQDHWSEWLQPEKDSLRNELRAAQNVKVNLDLCTKSKLSLSTKTDELKRMLGEESHRLLEANEKLSHANYNAERVTWVDFVLVFTFLENNLSSVNQLRKVRKKNCQH